MQKTIIDCLQERELLEAITNEELGHLTTSSIKAYIGFDPTADSLHLGNLAPMMVLGWLQRYGHTPVIILGGATGRIGDPSGKSQERPLLDLGTLQKNVAQIKKQFEKVVDFFDRSHRPLMLNNDDWLASFPLIDFLRDVGKHFRVNNMLMRDSVKLRLDSEEGISFTEFSYQLLQAYDFYYLFQEHKVVLQIGGSDQWGNIVSGIDLIRKMTGKQAYGLTIPLLTRQDGKKFGKSESGAIWLSKAKLSCYEFYQYLYRVADADVIRLLKQLTFMDIEEIYAIEKKMQEGSLPPHAAQKRLAEEVTRLIHEEEGLVSALKATEIMGGVQKEEKLSIADLEALSQNGLSITLLSEEVIGKTYPDLAYKIGLVESKSQAFRLIEEEGAYVNQEKIQNAKQAIEKQQLIEGKFLLLGAGKRKKMLIQVQVE